MRVLLSLLPLVALGCETATEPLMLDPAQADVWTSSETSISAGYSAIILPGGEARSDGMVVVAENGAVFSTIIEESTDTERAARWTADASGAITDPARLGDLPAPFEDASQLVRATDKNGDVVLGYAQNDRSGPTVPWLWLNGSMTMLLKPEGATRAWALAINDAGVVVGQVRFGSEGDYGAVWLPPYNTEPVLLPMLEGYILHSPRGITSAGVVTGLLRGHGLPDAIGQWRIDQEGTVLSGPVKLEASDGFFMGARATDFDVPGSFEFEGASVFRLDEGRRIDLGMLDGHGMSFARAATDRTQAGTITIVGHSQPTLTQHSESRPVVWSLDANGAGEGPVDVGLPDPYPNNSRWNQFESARASSINRQGWIVGYSTRADGARLVTLWQPASGGGDDDLPPGEGPLASFDYNCRNSAECDFVDTSTGEISTWSWTSTAGHSSVVQNPTFVFDQEGIHTVTLEVTDDNGLTHRASVSLTCSLHRRHGLRCS